MDQISEAKIQKKEIRSDARICEGVSSAWIIVATKRMQEAVVKLRLEQRGFEVYLPMRLVNGPKKGAYPMPFFPSNLFARATMNAARWQSIFTTPGVARVLCSPERPLGVRDEFIQMIRDREVEGFLHLIPRAPGLAERVMPTGKRVKKTLTTAAEVADFLQSEAIDERRAALLASFTGDSSMRITVDFRKAAAGGGI